MPRWTLHCVQMIEFLVLYWSKESLCSKHASGMYYVRANLPHNMVCSISHWHRMQLHSSLFCFLPAEVLWVVCGRPEAIWQSDGGVHKEAETRSSSDRNRSGWQHLSRQQRQTLQLATSSFSYASPPLHLYRSPQGQLLQLHGSTALFHSSIVSTHLITWCMHMYNVLH